jgi:hypothetical protein
MTAVIIPAAELARPVYHDDVCSLSQYVAVDIVACELTWIVQYRSKSTFVICAWISRAVGLHVLHQH